MPSYINLHDRLYKPSAKGPSFFLRSDWYKLKDRSMQVADEFFQPQKLRLAFP